MLLKPVAAPIAAVVAALALAGCPDPHDPNDPVTCDEVAPGAQVAIVHGGDGTLHDTMPGSEVPLYAAPQGGHILLIGARVQTHETCQVTINAALRDQRNSRVVGLEERDIVLVDRGDGWVAPLHPDQISNLANVAVCPTQAATVNIDGNAFQLEVRVTGGGKTLANTTLAITPTCEAGNTYCTGDCAVP